MAIFTSSIFIDIITIITTVLALTIAFFKWKLTFWEKLGVPTLNPVLFFGDAKNILLGKRQVGVEFIDYYKQFKPRGLKHGGVYLGPRPFWVITDPGLIKHILQIDFPHFINHGTYADEENDPLSAHLFSLEGTKWKNMRTKMTPTFTSGKMKMMFQTLVDCTPGLKDIMDEHASKKKAVNIKNILERFTTDIIGSVGFGIECNSLKDPDSLFPKYGKKVFDLTPAEQLKQSLLFFLPNPVLKAMKFRITNKDVEDFFMKTVRETVLYREKNNIYRKDFMHLLLQLKNRGTVTDDEKIIDHSNQKQEPALTMNELTAQAFVFFLAGFETSSTTMTFALYELATNPDIQEKLRNEICTVLEKHNNELTYNAIAEMTYMDQVLHETLRKYPPLPILQRQCNKDYIVPETNIRIPKGVDVAITILALHRDPEFYPNPEVFDPERFNEENKNARTPFTWLPFGDGPRVCIGLRFGMMQSKVGLTALLKDYRVTLNKKTKVPLEMSKNSFIIAAEGGIWLDIEKINT
ncbi:cytochrome P450 6a2 [Tribolium castaneum]|uniref:Cytochrome P450 6BQ12 n=1 Tax=Tribolium castaneum TaxID=7070 RepID=D2A095_TRICA|nr:PREDICTED: cytochrome P450 6a2 [Tribolium castaneum]EFA02825.1 cytochrome P450 6BQ12 [Tribolium castaneum]|eukprot:XP_975562.1 PREDICTED: cytochrome P450 6a2 [Tribolium castaneum]